MLPDRVLNPKPLTCESGALPIALRGPAGETACKVMVVLEPKLRETLPVNIFSYRQFFFLFSCQIITMVGILTFISRKNSIIGLLEPEKTTTEFLDIFILTSI